MGPGARDSVTVTSVSKNYFGARALRDVHLRVGPGRIHALIGGNGSGKSTLVKILAGVVRADTGGSVRVGNVVSPAHRWSLDDARAAGVRVVHQDPCVFPDATVVDNLAAGRGFETGFARRIRWSEARKQAQRVLTRFGIDADPDTPAASLRPAARTMLAVARALQDQEDGSRGLLILDEPTAALPRAEVQLLSDAIHGCADRGQAVLFVSHRLDEVLSLADEVTVLRDGANAGSARTADLDERLLVEMIVGRPLEGVFPGCPNHRRGRPRSRSDTCRGGPIQDVSFTIESGEVVGIAGLLGSGRTSLLRMLFGDLRRAGGDIVLDGTPVCFRTPKDGLNAGLAFVPEDRGGDAVFSDMSVLANLSASVVGSYWSAGRFRKRRERSDGGAVVDAFRVRTQTLDQPLSTLSGGNQQKVVLARWLRRSPRLLLLDEPTQGVDVGARADIYELIRAR